MKNTITFGKGHQLQFSNILKRVNVFLLLLMGIVGLPQNAFSQPVLYGMAKGGVNDLGVIFTVNIDGAGFQVLHHFIHENEGHHPKGNLKEHEGKFYGLTTLGGVDDQGVLFEYDPVMDKYTVKKEFIYKVDGNNPEGSLIEFNGKLYGLAYEGGNDGDGAIFEYNPISEVYTVKKYFDGNDGRHPYGSLTAYNGKLYGLTIGGGEYDYGVLFEYDPSANTYTKKKDFNMPDGVYPPGSLSEYNGIFYGVAGQGGGTGVLGVIFEYNPTTNSYTKLKEFGTTQERKPVGTPLIYNGKLYGMTAYGGANGDGAIFEIDLQTKTYAKIHDFMNPEGKRPIGSLTAYNGKLYGMTPEGGANGYGVIFEYDLSANIFSKHLDFDALNGYGPNGDLILYDSSASATNEINNPSGLIVFPNPTNSSVNVLWTGKGKLTYILTNSMGAEIQKGWVGVGESANNLVLDDLPVGIYYLSTLNENGFPQTTKIVKTE